MVRWRLKRLMEDTNMALGVLGPPFDPLGVVRAVVEGVKMFERSPIGDKEDSVALVWSLRKYGLGSSEDCVCELYH